MKTGKRKVQDDSDLRYHVNDGEGYFYRLMFMYYGSNYLAGMDAQFLSVDHCRRYWTKHRDRILEDFAAEGLDKTIAWGYLAFELNDAAELETAEYAFRGRVNPNDIFESYEAYEEWVAAGSPPRHQTDDDLRLMGVDPDKYQI